jgi:hypothetical protein
MFNKAKRRGESGVQKTLAGEAAGSRAFVQLDPLGFSAGTDNLFQYVGDDPTNMVDPTGLEEEKWAPTEYFKLKEGTGTPVPKDDLKEPTIMQGGQEVGIISVLTDATIRKASNPRTDVGKQIVIQFTITKAPARDVNDWSWVQFMTCRVYKTTKDTTPVDGVLVTVGVGPGNERKVKTGEMHLDSRNVGDIYYNGKGTSSVLIPGLVAIADRPAVPKNFKYDKVIFEAKTYLVNNKTGQVAYLVSWEDEFVRTIDGDFGSSFLLVSGKPVDSFEKTPDRLGEGKDEFLRGYNDKNEAIGSQIPPAVLGKLPKP